MKNISIAFMPTLDQILSSSTAPLFMFIGFMILPTDTYALIAQFIFLYGCLASICQAILGEPYLISCKQKSLLIESDNYTAASILISFFASIASFPFSFLITENVKLSMALTLPIFAMLLQDSKRTWRISNKSWFFLIASDGIWLIASTLFLIFVKEYGSFFIFVAWGVPGCISLLIILDYAELRRINLMKGLHLLTHFGRRYYFTLIETTFSGLSMVIANWAIFNFMGQSEISLFRYAVLFFGLSTVIINRQRVFDFANEDVEQPKVYAYRNTLRRMKEIWRVVAFNFFFICALFSTSKYIDFIDHLSFPGLLMFLVLALDRLSVGLMMSVTVFYKAHKNPMTIARIRTLVALSSAVIYTLLAVLEFKLELLIMCGTFPYFVAFGMIYRRIDKVPN